MVSESMRMPGPIDLRGGLVAGLLLDTGGYWLWRRERTGAGAVRPPSPVADHDEAIDEVLGWRLEVLGLASIEPERPIRVADGAEGMEPRVPAAVVCVEPVLSGDVLVLCLAGLMSRMLPSPVGEGNCVNLKSVDADSILACKSSKLTEGRKSNEPEGLCRASPFRFNEKCDWLLDEVSIGAFDTGWVAIVAAGGMLGADIGLHMYIKVSRHVK